MILFSAFGLCHYSVSYSSLFANSIRRACHELQVSRFLFPPARQRKVVNRRKVDTESALENYQAGWEVGEIAQIIRDTRSDRQDRVSFASCNERRRWLRPIRPFRDARTSSTRDLPAAPPCGFSPPVNSHSVFSVYRRWRLASRRSSTSSFRVHGRGLAIVFRTHPLAPEGVTNARCRCRRQSISPGSFVPHRHARMLASIAAILDAPCPRLEETGHSLTSLPAVVRVRL